MKNAGQSPLLFAADDPYHVLTDSKLLYLATERFALDQLLGMPVDSLDLYMAYIRSGDISSWDQYLKERDAVSVRALPKLVLRPVPDFSPLLSQDGSVDLGILADDLRLSATRYISKRWDEIRRKVPALAVILGGIVSPGSLNPSDSYLLERV